jgi:hypothetical protein
MFNFDNVENVTNKTIQVADVKVFANNKIRIGENAKKRLNLTAGRNIIIQRAGEVLIIASTDAESGAGRPTKNGEFSHQTIAHLLGGKYSELAIVGDGQEHPATKDVYYELEETVNGAEKREEFRIKAEAEAVEGEEVESEHESGQAVARGVENVDAVAEAENRSEMLAQMDEETSTTVEEEA